MTETVPSIGSEVPGGDAPRPTRDKPWVMRTYAGHSTPKDSNALYRRNLEKGQTGLSVAFDLPTQTGYDPDDELARGEVGKVGVPVTHLGDMRALFDGIPLDTMNTSMTINATAMWLLALYQAVAEEQGADASQLSGTTQNDIIKEYLSRGTYVFPPGPSLRLITDMVAYTVTEVPKWNPINICSYHLQEAGATPVQEISYALCTAIAVLDAVKAAGQVPEERFGEVCARISFFVNAGVRFVEEMCKMRAFTQLWDELLLERYGVQDAKHRRFRYGVQVNSLGLTEAQPENNVQRIVLEMLGVTLSKSARARAVQLPAWNEALGLPRPWDQQWSLRLQQVLAFETDLLEHDDLFEGSVVVEKQGRRAQGAGARRDRPRAGDGRRRRGRRVRLHEERAGRVARRAPPPHRGRRGRRRRRQPLHHDRAEPAHGRHRRRHHDRRPRGRAAGDRGGAAWRAARGRGRRRRGAARPARRRQDRRQPHGRDRRLRQGRASRPASGPARCARCSASTARPPASPARSPPVRPARRSARSARPCAPTGEELGVRLRLLVGKPGLDGHSNGAEQIAVRARDCGFEVVYQGIRLTASQIVAAAVEEDVHVIGLSILSGSHMEAVPAVLKGLQEAGVGDVPVVVGGIIPDGDAKRLQGAGRRRGLHAQGLRADRHHALDRRGGAVRQRPRAARLTGSCAAAGTRSPGASPRSTRRPTTSRRTSCWGRTSSRGT